MRRRTIVVLLLGAAAPWVTLKWVDPISFLFFALVSVLALAAAASLLLDAEEWALHVSVMGCVAALAFLIPLSSWVPSGEWMTMLPAVLKLGGSGILMGLAHLLLRVERNRGEEAWAEGFRRAREERRARGLTRGKAIEAHRRTRADPWD